MLKSVVSISLSVLAISSLLAQSGGRYEETKRQGLGYQVWPVLTAGLVRIGKGAMTIGTK